MEFCQQIIALPIFHFSLESIIDLLNSFEKVFLEDNRKSKQLVEIKIKTLTMIDPNLSYLEIFGFDRHESKHLGRWLLSLNSFQFQD